MLLKALGHVLSGGEHASAQTGARRVGGELLDAIEEAGDGRLQAGAAGFIEQSLHLLHGAEISIVFALLLGFLIELSLQQTAAAG